MRAAQLLLFVAQSDALRRAAIVTGGSRGIGLEISGALAEAGFDLLITYNSDVEAAEEAASALRTAHGCTVECVGGDISLTATRDEVFARYDATFKATHELGAVVHNAGQAPPSTPSS